MPTEINPAALDAVFDFKIGDSVTHVGFAPHYETSQFPGYVGYPQRYFVVQRVLEQCPGGVQKHYHCRAVMHDTGSRLGGQVITERIVVLNEVELRAFDPATDMPAKREEKANAEA